MISLKVLLEGISNYNGLTQNVISLVEKNLDKIIKNNKSNRNVNLKYSFKGEDGIDLNLTIIFQSSNKKNTTYGIAKTSTPKGFIIEICPELWEYDKVDILAVIAHEITHISQKLNNFRQYSFKILNDKYKKIPLNSETFRNYVNRTHSEHLIEHEARLVQLFELIKRNEFDKACKLLYEDDDYFKFGFKDFVKKAYSYYSISKEQILKIQNKFKEKITDKADPELTPVNFKKPEETIYSNFLWGIYLDHPNVIKMLNIDLNSRIKKILELIEDNSVVIKMGSTTIGKEWRRRAALRLKKLWKTN